jgi:hypothetical protein
MPSTVFLPENSMEGEFLLPYGEERYHITVTNIEA